MEGDVLVDITHSTFNFKDGKPGALIWQGKRSKPNKYVKFVSNESRNEYIDNYKKCTQ